MRAETLIEAINSEFYTGVPDSLLSPLCNFLYKNYGTAALDSDGKVRHIVAANEGNAAALAAGYHMATGKVPVVYLQNSGEGNIINPLASLLNDKVYGIPVVFIIGWRGEPGVHDEPQHIYQGMVTIKLLDDMDVSSFIIGKQTTGQELDRCMREFRNKLQNGKQVAFVIEKGALLYDEKISYSNDHSLKREDIIRHITGYSGDDPIVSTTGKASRELFEIREQNGQTHGTDFLTVGSMGHSSSIAFAIALYKPDKKVWCIDGDGAVLMHMGSLAVIGSAGPRNFVHILINNSAHDTVGGIPTVADDVKMTQIASACGYEYVSSVDSLDDLDIELGKIRDMECLVFLEIKAALGARSDLGRPTTSAIENKENFMEYLRQ